MAANGLTVQHVKPVQYRLLKIQIMRYIHLFTIILLISQRCIGQEFSFQLYFEDAVGTKDTLTLGYDTTATYSIDNSFNEIKIYSIPFNNTFEVRTSDGLQESSVPPSFYTKKQIIANPCKTTKPRWIQLDVKCDHFPMVVKWDKALFQNSCRLKTFITDWITGDVGPPYPPTNTFLAQSDSILFKTHQSFLEYLNNDDTIKVFYISIGDGVPALIGSTIESKRLIRHQVFPNPTSNIVQIQLDNEIQKIKSIDLFDLYGHKLITTDKKTLELNTLPDGFYFYKIIFSDNKIEAGQISKINSR